MKTNNEPFSNPKPQWMELLNELIKIRDSFEEIGEVSMLPKDIDRLTQLIDK